MLFSKLRSELIDSPSTGSGRSAGYDHSSLDLDALAHGDEVCSAALPTRLQLSLLLSHSYQYRFGGTMVGAIKTLFAEGGFGRYYAGLGPALFQGPIGERLPHAQSTEAHLGLSKQPASATQLRTPASSPCSPPTLSSPSFPLHSRPHLLVLQLHSSV